MKKVKAIALFSGGLDSILAVELIRRQGIEVQALYIKTGFNSEDIKVRLKLKNIEEIKAVATARKLGIPIITVDISDRYCKIIENPQYGYGKNANPCIDCRIEFLKVAKEFIDKGEFDFIITGEVVYQRPMTQKPSTMLFIDKKAGVKGLVLRPLSAKLLPITIPEKEGWVDREKLLDIKGRGRKRQIQLAKEFGLEEIPQPAGGCLLTDPQIAQRVFDQLEHKEWDCEIASLIPIGRHFRLPTGAKLIISRNEYEANYLMRFKDRWYVYKPTIKGPVGLLLKEKETPPTSEEQKYIEKILLRYSPKNLQQKVELVNS